MDEADRMGARGRADQAVLPLLVFGAALFSSAFLLFWVEPLFARMLLPRLGGSQGVWNTCLVFFQGSLLLGYAYAHLVARHLPLRAQFAVHAVVLAAGLALLPLSLPMGWAPPATGSPVPALMMMLTMTLGWPFVALSANAPLLQHWFAKLSHKTAANPYVLYAASNAGSLAALLAYPFLIEPNLTISGQNGDWAFAYGGLCLLIALSGAWAAFRGARGDAQTHVSAPSTPWRLRLTWLAYAALPSSLLIGVTGYVTTDIASFPLIWLAPLALYLLTFILVFAGKPPLTHPTMLKFLPVAITLAAIGFWLGPYSLGFALAVHFMAFFFIAMACHGELARLRPAVAQLTEFYFWMSVGGVVGGALTALVSPLLFKSIIEYPLAIALVCLMRPGGQSGATRMRDAALLAAATLVVLTEPLAQVNAKASMALSIALILYVASMGFLSKRKTPLIAALYIVLASYTAHTLMLRHGDVVWRDRSFYGAYSITEDKKAGYRIMFHGTTQHGVERMDETGRPEPLSYYAKTGPLGDVMHALGPTAHAVGAIGLGVGSSACYARDGQDWTFYEIDPLVDNMAVHSGMFRSVPVCAPQAKVVLGDGRLRLEAEPSGRYDILILDAFTSDAIPIHLVTREAFASYTRAIGPHGVIVMHITNRHLNLSPIVARIAGSLNLTMVERDFTPPPGADLTVESPSRWLVVAKDPTDLGALDHLRGWTRRIADARVKLWTDDFSNILSALR